MGNRWTALEHVGLYLCVGPFWETDPQTDRPRTDPQTDGQAKCVDISTRIAPKKYQPAGIILLAADN